MTKDETSLETPATWAELNRCGHELSQFKEALVTLSRQGRLSKEAHDQRVQAVDHLSTRLERLRVLSRERCNLQKEIHDLGLPNVKGLGDREIKLIDQMLNQRLGILKISYNEIKKLTAWVEEGMRGESRGWRGTMRLGKFKKVVAELEQQEAIVDKETKGQSLFIKKVSASLTSMGTAQHEGNLETLMKLFAHINNLSARLSRLDDKIRKEKGVINQMSAWLLKQQQTQSQASKMKAPSLVEIQAAEALSKSDHFDPLEYSRKRLTVAQKFVSQCQEATESSQASIPGAPKMTEEDDSLAN